jgi:hypothetical protein
MMVVVRTPPNAAWAEGQDSKDSHENLGRAGVGQYRVMLLIVINHKQPENQKPGEKTADQRARDMKIPESPPDGSRQEERGGKYMPPAPRRRIHRVRFCCQYELLACSHARFSFFSILG